MVDDLSAGRRTHTVKGENGLLQLSSDLYIHHAHTLLSTQSENKEIKVENNDNNIFKEEGCKNLGIRTHFTFSETNMLFLTGHL